MGGLLVRDKNFWIIKYPKQSELPTKHFGSHSLNLKTGAINLRSLNPFHMDFMILAKFNVKFCGHIYFVFSGKKTGNFY